jgi:hypothetical protein
LGFIHKLQPASKEEKMSKNQTLELQLFLIKLLKEKQRNLLDAVHLNSNTFVEGEGLKSEIKLSMKSLRL